MKMRNDQAFDYFLLANDLLQFIPDQAIFKKFFRERCNDFFLNNQTGVIFSGFIDKPRFKVLLEKALLPYEQVTDRPSIFIGMRNTQRHLIMNLDTFKKVYLQYLDNRYMWNLLPFYQNFTRFLRIFFLLSYRSNFFLSLILLSELSKKRGE